MDDTGHLTSNECDGYWQRTLAPAALLAVSDHLQECAKCREQLRRGKPGLSPNEPITYEELVAWTDGTGDPLTRRNLAERIGNSPAAAADLLNLVQFRDEVRELPASEPALAPGLNWRAGLRRAWPLAAGLVLGFAFMWWSAAVHRPAAAVVLSDGGETLVVRPNGEIPALGPLPPALQESVRAALARGEANRPAFLDDLRGRPENLASAPTAAESLRVLEPVGSVVAAERPVLRWSGEPGATGYRVNLLPRGGLVQSSPLLPARAHSWSPNESLQPNETYEWEVQAFRGDELLAQAPAPPAPEARFRVLAAATRSELQQARQKWGASHLLMGLADARAGLVAEARDEFEALARANPQSKLPAELLASLTNQRSAPMSTNGAQ